MCNLMIPNSLSNLAQLLFVIDANVIARKSGRYLFVSELRRPRCHLS